MKKPARVNREQATPPLTPSLHLLRRFLDQLHRPVEDELVHADLHRQVVQQEARRLTAVQIEEDILSSSTIASMDTAIRVFGHYASDPRITLGRVPSEHNTFEAVRERHPQIHSESFELESFELPPDSPFFHNTSFAHCAVADLLA